MGMERIREIGERLREFADFAQGDYIYTSVTIEEEDYYVDLGAFGEQSLSVSVEDNSYQLDADDILDKFPITSGTFYELAEELEQYEEAPREQEPPVLEDVLALMESDGQGALVTALRSVVRAFQDATLAAAKAVTAAAVPLPPKPLPWPGALRDDIDYVAADFPLRYQPPPGYQWTVPGSYSSNVMPLDSLQPYKAEDLRTKRDGKMILDSKGRVSWKERADDDLADGIRWSIWFLERDGIPAGSGQFSGPTLPMPVDASGNIIGDWRGADGRSEVWNSASVARGKQRVAEILAEFDQQATDYGVFYDPLTVEVTSYNDEQEIMTMDLRLGDDITGDAYGRVISVEMKSNGRCLITMNRDGKINTADDYDEDTGWSVLPIVGVDRDAQPTALSLSGSNGYDPLTVGLKDEVVFVPSKELRLGDDILGDSFGRVVAIENDEIVMNRNGTVNRTKYGADFAWSIKMIDVPNRDSVPTAASLQPVAF